tara:strand:- start:333 stop:557 length:225 start_codon:yes stop_codon:yes gene_type:complete
MSGMLNVANITDEMLRGIAISAVFRGLVERKPVFSMGTINDGFKYGGASLLYSVARPPINQALQGSGISLPNGN